MKLIKERECPCCQNKITIKDYLRYLESNAGEVGEIELLSCSKCKHIILSTNEYNKWSEGMHLLMFYITVILLYFVHENAIYTYIIYSLLIISWLIFLKYIPYIFVKFKCYSRDEIKIIDQESGSSVFIGIGTVVLFYGLIFFIFFTLATEYKASKKTYDDNLSIIQEKKYPSLHLSKV